MKLNLTLLIAFYMMFNNVHIQAEYQIPKVNIEVLKPKGFSASIPDSSEVMLFQFSANVNKEIKSAVKGDIQKHTTERTDGKWMIVDNDTELKEGDVLNYWTFVQVGKFGYRSDVFSFKVA